VIDKDSNSDYYGDMKIRLIILAALLLACSSNKNKIALDERFRNEMIDAADIGKLTPLTQDGRSIYPIFAPGDTIVYYKRLLITDAVDTFIYKMDEMIKPYGIGISNGELYTLSKPYDYPSTRVVPPSDYPRRYGEKVDWALRSPADSNVIAFETVTSDNENAIHILYLAIGDSIIQLSFGNISCFLDQFSNTGRYLSAIYDQGPTWIIVYDIKKGRCYRINHEGDSIDYLSIFSPDDSMMLFIRSDKKYRYGKDYFGDVWLLKFNQ
jgi:hypothetical protein